MISTRTRIRTLAVLVGGLTVLGVGATAGAFGSDGPARAAAGRPTVAVVTAADRSTTASTAAPIPAAGDGRVVSSPLSAADAGHLAVAELGGGNVVNVESEVEHGRRQWKVDLARAGGVSTLRLDALTGTVTRSDVRGDSDDRAGRVTAVHRTDDRRGDDGSHRGRGSDDGAGHDVFDDHGGRH
jgi:hypothetical protein